MIQRGDDRAAWRLNESPHLKVEKFEATPEPGYVFSLNESPHLKVEKSTDSEL